MATRTISEAGGNWSALGTWVEGVVPTKEDDVVATSKSGNLTLDVASCPCRDFDMTNYTKTLAHNTGVVLEVYRHFKLVAGMTYAPVGARKILLLGTEVGLKFTCGGKKLGTLEITGTGEWIAQDKLTINATSGSFNHKGGTFRGNGQDAEIMKYIATGAIAGTTIDFGGGTWSFLDLSGAILTFVSNLTVEALNSTLNINGKGTGTRKLTLLTKTLGTLTYTEKESFALEILHTGATINTLNMWDEGWSKTLILSASQTLTFTNINIKGFAGKLLIVESTVSGTKATISKASGYVQADYLKLKDSKAAGGAVWFAGKHSESVSGNEGWLFGERMFAAAALSGSAGLVSRGVRRRRESATLSGSAELSGNAIRRRHDESSLDASSTLSGDGRRRRTGAGQLSGEGTLTVQAVRRRAGRVFLEASTFLSSSGITRKFGRVQFSATASLTAQAHCLRFASAELQAISSLEAEGKTITGATYNVDRESAYSPNDESSYGVTKGASYDVN